MWTNPSPAHGAEAVFRSMNDYVRLLNASEKPMIVLRGNHETIGGFADKMAYLFDLPNLSPTKNFIDQNWYFTMQAGPVWFLGLDGGDDFIKRYDLFQPYRQRQAEWMKGLLTHHAGADASWRIVLTHMPLYNNNIWTSEPCRLMWEPVLKDAKIDLEFSGHDHTWKTIPKGKTYHITFNGHYPDQQDPEKRKSYSFTSLWPVIIGGGPRLSGAERGTVMLLKAQRGTLEVEVRAVEIKPGENQQPFTLRKDSPTKVEQ
jgi:hypothetical protein